MKILLVLLFLVFTACEPEIDWDNTKRAALVNVCEVTPYKDVWARHCGVGFYISPMKILTAYHVLTMFQDTIEDANIAIYRGNNLLFWIDEITDRYGDIGNDQAIITVNRPSDVYFDICEHNAPMRSDVYVAGYQNAHLTLYGGWREKVRHWSLSGWIRTSAPAHRGESGSPMIDSANGCVTGITAFGVDNDYSMGPGVRLINELLGKE